MPRPGATFAASEVFSVSRDYTHARSALGAPEEVVMKRTARTLGIVFASGIPFFAAQGCVATQGWVNERVAPTESRLNEVDAKADRALAGLDNLHLERRFVLDMKDGATFGFGSANLTPHAKSEIDRFFKQLEESSGEGNAAAENVFVVAGHTDSVGSPDYNYELGQRRAERVAGYLVSEKGVDPMQLRVASFGASKPIASNKRADGRRANRRIEILVYEEKVATFWDKMTTAFRGSEATQQPAHGPQTSGTY
jgi:outer membrane protein OmpA-like peptidoglycan-associated protein